MDSGLSTFARYGGRENVYEFSMVDTLVCLNKSSPNKS